MNQVTLVGRVVQDPVSMGLTDGNSVARFNVAVDRYYGHAQKEEKKKEGKAVADFPRVVVWGKQADNAAKYLKKGSLISIAGKISTGSYEQEGVKKYVTEIVANSVEYLSIAKRETEKTEETKVAEEPAPVTLMSGEALDPETGEIYPS